MQAASIDAIYGEAPIAPPPQVKADGPTDEQMADMLQEADEWMLTELRSMQISLVYTNHRGVTNERHIIPRRVFFGTTSYHERPQWLLDCWDVDKHAARTYALGQCDFLGPREMSLEEYARHLGLPGMYERVRERLWRGNKVDP